jgi:hypothetical protein
MQYLFPRIDSFSGIGDARQFVENHKFFFLMQLIFYVLGCISMVLLQTTLSVGQGAGFFGFVLAMQIVIALMKSFATAMFMSLICGNYSWVACVGFLVMQLVLLGACLLEPSFMQAFHATMAIISIYVGQNLLRVCYSIRNSAVS